MRPKISYFLKYAQMPKVLTGLAMKYNNAAMNIGRTLGLVSPSINVSKPIVNTIKPINSGAGMFDRFLNAIKMQESGGNFRAINKQSGALGLYQFMPKTLRGLGYQGSFQDFLNNPALQTEYMKKFTLQNAKALNIDINKMTPQQAGYLAAAHYGGIGGARKIMSGNQVYANTPFYGKTPNSYISDILKRL